MGSCCCKQMPNVQVNTEADGNTCCDDLEYSCPCQSTCCIIVRKGRVKHPSKHHTDKKSETNISK